MSLFSSIGKGLKAVAKSIIPTVASFIPGVGGAVAGAAASALTAPRPAPAPPITTAGTAAGGLAQTLPAMTGPPVGPGVPTPQGLMSQLGQIGGQFLRGAAVGAGVLPARTGAGGAIGTKVGRLTGNMIPRGYVERMSQSGVIYLAKQKRRRGISSRDISSFYRVNRLVAKIHGRVHRAPARGRK